jgi:aminopeptidase
MTDVRLQRLADVLVQYSVEVKRGDWVHLGGDASGLPALRALYQSVVRAGANPTISISDEFMGRTLLREGSEDQLAWVSPLETLLTDQVDATIRLIASNNTRAMTSIDPKRQQHMQLARGPIMETIMRRSAEGALNWVLTLYPTEAGAQEANMSLEEYADFVYSATFCDREDPVAEWRKVSEMQQQKVDWLKGKKHVRLQGPNIDLELSIADRVFLNADGRRNMPDGEIFTGPVENSANGWVRFTYPSIVNGKAVSGIELRFSEGKVIEARAEQNDDLLQSQLNADEGARYLGEFAIGTNFGINRFTGNILFDEKIGGTVHMAVGRSYPETGGVNRSVIHWDMICDMRTDSEIHVDSELFYKNGQFIV